MQQVFCNFGLILALFSLHWSNFIQLLCSTLAVSWTKLSYVLWWDNNMVGLYCLWESGCFNFLGKLSCFATLENAKGTSFLDFVESKCFRGSIYFDTDFSKDFHLDEDVWDIVVSLFLNGNLGGIFRYWMFVDFRLHVSFLQYRVTQCAFSSCIIGVCDDSLNLWNLREITCFIILNFLIHRSDKLSNCPFNIFYSRCSDVNFFCSLLSNLSR